MSDETKKVIPITKGSVIELALATTLFEAVLYRMVLLCGNEVKLSANEDLICATGKKLFTEIRAAYNSPHASDAARFEACMIATEQFITNQAKKNLGGATSTKKPLVQKAPLLTDVQGRRISSE